jgi:hypothetical protein
MLFGRRKMIYIIRKKNSPYYIRNITKTIDANYENLKIDATFTDVKDLIELKIQGKNEAIKTLNLLKNTYPKEQMEFELEKLNGKK